MPRDLSRYFLVSDPVTVYVIIDGDVNETNPIDIECDARNGNPGDIEYHWEFYPKYDDLGADFSCFERKCQIPVAER